MPHTGNVQRTQQSQLPGAGTITQDNISQGGALQTFLLNIKQQVQQNPEKFSPDILRALSKLSQAQQAAKRPGRVEQAPLTDVGGGLRVAREAILVDSGDTGQAAGLAAFGTDLAQQRQEFGKAQQKLDLLSREQQFKQDIADRKFQEGQRQFGITEARQQQREDRLALPELKTFINEEGVGSILTNKITGEQIVNFTKFKKALEDPDSKEAGVLSKIFTGIGNFFSSSEEAEGAPAGQGGGLAKGLVNLVLGTDVSEADKQAIAAKANEQIGATVDFVTDPVTNVVTAVVQAGEAVVAGGRKALAGAILGEEQSKTRAAGFIRDLNLPPPTPSSVTRRDFLKGQRTF